MDRLLSCPPVCVCVCACVYNAKGQEKLWADQRQQDIFISVAISFNSVFMTHRDKQREATGAFLTLTVGSHLVVTGTNDKVAKDGKMRPNKQENTGRESSWHPLVVDTEYSNNIALKT